MLSRPQSGFVQITTPVPRSQDPSTQVWKSAVSPKKRSICTASTRASAHHQMNDLILMITQMLPNRPQTRCKPSRSINRKPREAAYSPRRSDIVRRRRQQLLHAQLHRDGAADTQRKWEKWIGTGQRWCSYLPACRLPFLSAEERWVSISSA